MYSEHTIRELFPVTKESIYFNHASTGPMSVPARRVIEHCMDIYSRQAEFNLEEYFGRLHTVRQLVARLIHAEPEEIAFTHNTSEGIYIALINLPLAEGDEILIMDEVFPTVRYVVDYNVPYLEKKYVPFSGRDPVEVVKEHLTSKVKAVVIDWVQYSSGEMLDLDSLGTFLLSEGIYLIVDSIQGIGSIDFNVQKTHVDFLANGAAKWLFGPSGTGFVYVNKKNFPSLKKFHTGWLGREWTSFENCDSDKPLFEDARMFEQGTRNMIGINAFGENVKILLEYGLSNVHTNIMRVKTQLLTMSQELDLSVITPLQDPCSGIFTVKPRKNARALYEHLAKNKVVISLRSGCLRFSPHFYNTAEEVDLISSFLKQV